MGTPDTTDLYRSFEAPGFDQPVVGQVYDAARRPTQGMPLGGIGTGAIDLDATGTLGLMTIFNSHVPRRGPVNEPYLGVSAGDRFWVLSTQRFAGYDMPGLHSYRTQGGLRFAEDIKYWGHYPAVDMEYVTDAPLKITMRAWAPFIPGDLTWSSSPVGEFAVTLTNSGTEPVDGRLVFSFPGPTDVEAGGLPARHEQVAIDGHPALRVICPAGDYVVAAVGGTDVQVGSALGIDGWRWRQAADSLPTAAGAPGASISVQYQVEPGRSAEISFVLAWHFPEWEARGNPDPALLRTQAGYQRVTNDASWQSAQSPNKFQHMYATRFPDAVGVAQAFVATRERLLRRVLDWQSEIYSEDSFPRWLRDGLVNSLHLITETSLWASARTPIGSWCRSEDGLFGMIEDPRNCPQIENVPCSFYGNYPLVYFFPELALSTLRGYRAYQFPDGQPTWIFGGMTADPATYPIEMTRPGRGYQQALNGACVVDMLYRYWRCTGDNAALVELYGLAKGATVYTMGLRAEDGPKGVISFPAGDSGLDWFEACSWAGMAAHLGGIHLAQLRQAEAIAEAVGDSEFAAQCRKWFDDGSAALEEHLWLGTHYVNYWDQSTGDRSDLVMSNQLDGEWMARLAGQAGVFDQSRVSTVLDTVRRTCVEGHLFGAVNFADHAGRATTSGEGKPGWNYNPHAYFVPENIMLAATYFYAGHASNGWRIAETCWENLDRHGLTWDQPNLLSAETGEPIYGNDYYQNMIIWTLPAAASRSDLVQPTREGGFVQRILVAAGSTH
jgi:uncharacterized protein (DUF608 family)